MKTNKHEENKRTTKNKQIKAKENKQNNKIN